MPSYNLPVYPSSAEQQHQDHASRKGLQSKARARPVPLNLQRPSAHNPPPSTPRSPSSEQQLPASIRIPHSGGQWSPSMRYYRSPLAPSRDPDPRRLCYPHAPPPPPSRRYVRAPPISAPAAVQAFSLPLPGRGLKGRDDRLFEEMVAKTLEKRLREKCTKSKIGERAGLGIAAGREMGMWAALGTLREARLRAHLDHPSSAPAFRTSFPHSADPAFQYPSIITSPLQRDPPSSVLLARALGHRKSASTSSSGTFAPHPHRFPPELGNGLRRTPSTEKKTLPSFDAIRGFIARRTSGSGSPASEDPEDVSERDVIEIRLPTSDASPPSPTRPRFPHSRSAPIAPGSGKREHVHASLNTEKGGPHKPEGKRPLFIQEEDSNPLWPPMKLLEIQLPSVTQVEAGIRLLHHEAVDGRRGARESRTPPPVLPPKDRHILASPSGTGPQLPQLPPLAVRAPLPSVRRNTLPVIGPPARQLFEPRRPPIASTHERHSSRLVRQMSETMPSTPVVLRRLRSFHTSDHRDHQAGR